VGFQLKILVHAWLGPAHDVPCFFAFAVVHGIEQGRTPMKLMTQQL